MPEESAKKGADKESAPSGSEMVPKRDLNPELKAKRLF